MHAVVKVKLLSIQIILKHEGFMFSSIRVEHVITPFIHQMAMHLK